MNQFYIGVKALIIHKGRLLVTHRSDKYQRYKVENFWDIPGGRIKLGEGPELALRREVLEETGLHIDKILKILDASTICKNEREHIIRITDLCTINPDEISELSLSDEHTAAKWISPKNACFKDLLIQKVIDNLNFYADEIPP